MLPAFVAREKCCLQVSGCVCLRVFAPLKHRKPEVGAFEKSCLAVVVRPVADCVANEARGYEPCSSLVYVSGNLPNAAGFWLAQRRLLYQLRLRRWRPQDGTKEFGADDLQAMLMKGQLLSLERSDERPGPRWSLGLQHWPTQWVRQDSLRLWLLAAGLAASKP